MPLTKIEANDFTVFENIEIPFNKGLNVLVGENGMGKTYIMKLAYAACQASKHDVSFSQKTTMLFRPDQSSMVSRFRYFQRYRLERKMKEMFKPKEFFLECFEA